MARKRHSDEDILKLLREIELNLASGNDVGTACRSVGIELMRWMSPPAASSVPRRFLRNHAKEATVMKISLLAVDLAKGSLQVFGVGADGAVLFNRSLSRSRLLSFLAEQPACVVAMEACATSHHWGRVAQSHGHEVRLVPAIYVKPFVKRQKNDKAD